jgi:hypothetical protein
LYIKNIKIIRKQIFCSEKLKSFRNNTAKRNAASMKIWLTDQSEKGDLTGDDVQDALSHGWNQWSYPQKYDRLVNMKKDDVLRDNE